MLQLADQNIITKAMPKGISSEEWQDYKISCDGDHIQIWANYVKTIDNRIGLQKTVSFVYRFMKDLHRKSGTRIS